MADTRKIQESNGRLIQSDALKTPFQSFSCVRRGIDGFISAVDWVVDRETAEADGVE